MTRRILFVAAVLMMGIALLPGTGHAQRFQIVTTGKFKLGDLDGDFGLNFQSQAAQPPVSKPLSVSEFHITVILEKPSPGLFLHCEGNAVRRVQVDTTPQGGTHEHIEGQVRVHLFSLTDGTSLTLNDVGVDADANFGDRISTFEWELGSPVNMRSQVFVLADESRSSLAIEGNFVGVGGAQGSLDIEKNVTPQGGTSHSTMSLQISPIQGPPVSLQFDGEIVIMFLEGDSDRPFVLGNILNVGDVVLPAPPVHLDHVQFGAQFSQGTYNFTLGPDPRLDGLPGDVIRGNNQYDSSGHFVR